MGALPYPSGESQRGDGVELLPPLACDGPDASDPREGADASDPREGSAWARVCRVSDADRALGELVVFATRLAAVFGALPPAFGITGGRKGGFAGAARF